MNILIHTNIRESNVNYNIININVEYTLVEKFKLLRYWNVLIVKILE